MTITMMMDLPDQLILEILGFLPPIELFQSISFVSKSFSCLILEQDAVWKHWMEYIQQKQKQQQQQPSLSKFSKHQMYRYCLYYTSLKTEKRLREENNNNNNNINNKEEEENKIHRNMMERETKKMFHVLLTILQDGSVLAPRDLATSFRQQSNGMIRSCLASTTEHDVEHIENVLYDDSSDYRMVTTTTTTTMTTNATTMIMDPWQVFLRQPKANRFTMWGERPLYWSSKPTATQDTNETLVFCTNYPDTLLNEVWIQPLTDPDFPDKHYTWKGIQIQVYRLTSSNPSKVATRRDKGQKEGDDNNNNNNEKVTLPTLPYPDGVQYCVIPGQEENVARNHHFMAQSAQSDQQSILQLLGDHNNQTNNNNDPKQTATSQTVVPIYQSQVYLTPHADNVDWQHYSFPPGIVGNLIRITLIGKNARQYDTSGYYVCVDRLAIRGIPLYRSAKDQDSSSSSPSSSSSHVERHSDPPSPKRICVLKGN